MPPQESSSDFIARMSGTAADNADAGPIDPERTGSDSGQESADDFIKRMGGGNQDEGIIPSLLNKVSPGKLMEMWNDPKFNKPIAEASPEQLAIQERFRKAHPYASIPIDKMQGLIDSLTSKKGMAIAGTALASPLVAASSIPAAGAVATGLAIPGIIAAGEMGYHGIKGAWNAKTGPELISNLIDAGMGVAGVKGGLHETGSLRATADAAKAGRAATAAEAKATAAAAEAERTKYDPVWGPNEPNAKGEYGDTGVPQGPNKSPVDTGRVAGPFRESPYSPSVTRSQQLRPNVRGLLPAAPTFYAGSEGTYPRPDFPPEFTPTTMGEEHGPFPTGDTGEQHGPWEASPYEPPTSTLPPAKSFYHMPEGEDTIPENERMTGEPVHAGIYEHVPTTEPIPKQTLIARMEEVIKEHSEKFKKSITPDILSKLKGTINDTSGEMDIDRMRELIGKIVPDSESAARISEAVIDNITRTGRYDQDVARSGGQVDIPTYERFSGLGDLPNEPSSARSEAGGLTIGMNVRRGAQNLTKDYSSPLPGIMVRESLQNAIDAIKKIGSGGEVTIKTHKIPGASDYHGFTVTDNGLGLTKQELETKLTDLFETGKEGEQGAGGGKGIGSASYMLGGKDFSIETVAQDGPVKRRLVYSGTPDEFFDKEVGVLPKIDEVVPDSTPTGTKIDVNFTDEQAKKQDYAANFMATDIAQFSRDIPGKFTVNRQDLTMHDQPFKSFADDKLVGSFEHKNNKVDIYIPQDVIPVPNSNSTMVRYLNNGMHQFTNEQTISDKSDFLPDNVLVNIQPQVDDLHDDYPFTNTREHLKDAIGKMINDRVEDDILKPAMTRRANRTQELYDSMKDVNIGVVTRRPVVIFDPGDRMTPDEMNTMQNSPVIRKLAETYDFLINQIIEASGRTNWADRLEKTGIFFDPKRHGVFIPNPSTGQAAILINPFPRWQNLSPYESAVANVVTAMHEVSHIGLEAGNPAVKPTSIDMSNPRYGQYIQHLPEQTMLHADTGYENTGHGTGFLTRLAEVFNSYGPDKFFKGADEINAITGAGIGRYNPEIQNLLQIYNDSRGRPATTEDLLSPTGTGERSNSGGSGGVTWNDSTNGKGTTSESTAAPKQSAAASRDAAAATAAANELLSTLASGGRNYQSIREVSEGITNKGRMLDPDIVKDLMKGITNSDLSTLKQANAKLALSKILAGEKPYASDMNLLRQVYGDKWADNVVAATGQNKFDYPTIRNRVADGVNVTKALMASLNMHAPLRQGLPLIGTKAYSNAFGEMIKMYGSQAAYEGAMKAVEEHPLYELARQSGVSFTNLTEDLSKREEEFFSPMVEKYVPWVKPASRAYSGFLNKLRMDTFADMVNLMEKNKVLTPDGVKAAAEFTNNATGRGSLGRFEKNAVELNTLFFSPRTVASRVRMYNLLNPMDTGSVFRETNPIVRQAKIRAIVTMGVWTLSMMAAAKAVGAKVSDDPTSPDFGKIHMKNMRIDPYGGFQQYAVFGARLVNGLAKGENVMPTVGRFAENKLSPVAAFVTDMMLGKSAYRPDKIGHDLFPKNDNVARGVNDLIPMTANDLYEVYKDDPDLLPAAFVPALFGATVTDYRTTPRGFSVPTVPKARIPRF